MRKLLTLCAILLSLSASAQWQLTGSKVRYVNGIGIPTKDTAAGVLADSSQILIRPADSSLYVKYKRTWIKVGGAGITGSGAAGQATFWTGASAISGDNAFFWDNTNKRLGINTATPGARLDIHGTGVIAQFNGTTTNNAFLDFKNAGSTQWRIGNQYAAAVNRFSIFNAAGSTEFFTILQSGNIGVNTTTPQAPLEVGKVLSAGLGGQIAIKNSAASAVGNAVEIAFLTDVNASPIAFRNARIRSENENAGTGATNIQFWTFNGSTDAERMRLSSGGAVLINTTTDNGVDKLQVNGSGLVTGNFVAASSSGNVSLRTTANTYPFNISVGANAGIGFHQDGTVATIIGTNQNISVISPLQFQATQFIFSTGRISVNTSSDNGVDELQVNGSISGSGFKQAYVTKTGAYTATNDDYIIDCTSGTFTVTLPASSGRTGRILIIKNSGTGTITVDGNASETIDGAATYSLSAQYATVQIVSDGTNWKIISKF